MIAILLQSCAFVGGIGTLLAVLSAGLHEGRED